MFFKGESRDKVLNYPTAERRGSRRIWELDFLRGLMIILMCLDHLVYDLAFVFFPPWFEQGGTAARIARFASQWWDGGLTILGRTHEIMQLIAHCVFFGLCGGSTIFSRDNASRAMKTLLAASIITLGTYSAAVLEIVERSDIITFGVLHMLALSTLIVSAVYSMTRLSERYGDQIFVAVSVLLAVGIFLANHFISVAGVSTNKWLMFLHSDFSEIAWMGGDYFPLIPYLGYAFAGAAIITLFYGGGKSLLPSLDGGWNRPFRFAGKHTLIIVIVHQVVNMLLLALITAAFVDFGNFVIF